MTFWIISLQLYASVHQSNWAYTAVFISMLSSDRAKEKLRVLKCRHSTHVFNPAAEKICTITNVFLQNIRMSEWGWPLGYEISLLHHFILLDICGKCFHNKHVHYWMCSRIWRNTLQVFLRDHAQKDWMDGREGTVTLTRDYQNLISSSMSASGYCAKLEEIPARHSWENELDGWTDDPQTPLRLYVLYYTAFTQNKAAILILVKFPSTQHAHSHRCNHVKVSGSSSIQQWQWCNSYI